MLDRITPLTAELTQAVEQEASKEARCNGNGGEVFANSRRSSCLRSSNRSVRKSFPSSVNRSNAKKARRVPTATPLGIPPRRPPPDTSFAIFTLHSPTASSSRLLLRHLPMAFPHSSNQPSGFLRLAVGFEPTADSHGGLPRRPPMAFPHVVHPRRALMATPYGIPSRRSSLGGLATHTSRSSPPPSEPGSGPQYTKASAGGGTWVGYPGCPLPHQRHIPRRYGQ